MKDQILIIGLLFITVVGLQAQKVAIIGVNEDQPDGFTFVALENLPAGTRIYFSTKEYLSGTCKYEEMGEEVAYWDAPASGLALGEVVFVKEPETTPNAFELTCSAGNGTDACGTFTLVSGSFNIGTQDELSLFGDADNDITNGVDTVYSLAYHDHRTTGATELPAANDPRGDMPCGETTLVLDELNDLAEQSGHFQYTGPRTLPIFRENLENPANYTIAANAIDLDVTAFTGVSPAIERALGTAHNQMNAYPNPAGDHLTILFQKPLKADATLEVYDLHGHLLQEKPIAIFSRNIDLDIAQLTTGTYLVRVVAEDHSFVKKFIKE